MSRVLESEVARLLGALTVDGPAELAGTDPLVAVATRTALLGSAAAQLLSACCHAAGPCDELCALAADLAPLAPGRPGPASTGDARARFAAAVAASAGQVQLCRRVAHPVGACWFSTDGAAADVCGRLLAATHRAGI